MLSRWLTKRGAGALIVSALVGASAWTATALGASSTLQLPNTAPAVSFPSNAAGQTYGSAAGVPLAQRPDLVSAVGAASSGGQVTGYVLSSQLDAATGADVQTPQQATAWMHTVHATSIPLYAQDGTTVVGSFSITKTQASSTRTTVTPAPNSSDAPSTVHSSCGSWGYYGPIEGYDYQNQSCIVFNTGSAGSYGSITAQTQHGSNVPSGWMGILPVVYRSDGVVCMQGSWYYNGGSASGLSDAVYRPAAHCGSGYYYSEGDSRAWNGNGYYTYSSFRSPNLQL